MSTYAPNVWALDLPKVEQRLYELLWERSPEHATCYDPIAALAEQLGKSTVHVRRALRGLIAKRLAWKAPWTRSIVVYSPDNPAPEVITGRSVSGDTYFPKPITGRSVGGALTFGNRSSDDRETDHSAISLNSLPYTINTNTVVDACEEATTTTEAGLEEEPEVEATPPPTPDPDPIQPPPRGMVASLGAAFQATTTAIGKALGQKPSEASPVDPATLPPEVVSLQAQHKAATTDAAKWKIQGDLMALGYRLSGAPLPPPTDPFARIKPPTAPCELVAKQTGDALAKARQDRLDALRATLGRLNDKSSEQAADVAAAAIADVLDDADKTCRLYRVICQRIRTGRTAAAEVMGVVEVALKGNRPAGLFNTKWKERGRLNGGASC